MRGWPGYFIRPRDDGEVRCETGCASRAKPIAKRERGRGMTARRTPAPVKKSRRQPILCKPTRHRCAVHLRGRPGESSRLRSRASRDLDHAGRTARRSPPCMSCASWAASRCCCDWVLLLWHRWRRTTHGRERSSLRMRPSPATNRSRTNSRATTSPRAQRARSVRRNARSRFSAASPFGIPATV